MRLLCAGLLSAALIGLVATGRADDKKPEPKPEAKGTLTLNGKTYKLEHALAYETTKFDVKFTTIYLSEKPLDASKLKASFKKKGNDDDFHAFDAHLRLMFDDTGKLFQISMHAGGANIILQGDPNIRAEATIKDGVAKGTAKSVKPDKDYEFEVAFDVKLTKP